MVRTRPPALLSQPAVPAEGLQTFCWEVCPCLLWGFGNLELRFLPHQVKNLTVILKAGEEEGEDVTTGMLQPRVQ